MTTVLHSLNAALHDVMRDDPRVLFLGEDILDPYGGAFKVAQGLSTRFPDRVLTTPISEQAIVGIAAGLALRGYRLVVEIMFGDFMTLTADQLINHACKFRAMYNGQVTVPMVVRTPMGGRRGYGPTHSQSLEKHFLGIPGLTVVAPNSLTDPGALLRRCVLQSEAPVLFLEHKVLYPARCKSPDDLPEFVLHVSEEDDFPTVTITIQGAPAPVATIAAYGYGAELVLESMLQLAMDHEVFVEAVIPTCLSPLDPQPFFDSVKRTNCLLTVEEGGAEFGWGSEVAFACWPAKPHGIRRLGALGDCIPSSKPLEEAMLPSVQDVIEAVLDLTGVRV